MPCASSPEVVRSPGVRHGHRRAAAADAAGPALPVERAKSRPTAAAAAADALGGKRDGLVADRGDLGAAHDRHRTARAGAAAGGAKSHHSDVAAAAAGVAGHALGDDAVGLRAGRQNRAADVDVHGPGRAGAAPAARGRIEEAAVAALSSGAAKAVGADAVCLRACGGDRVRAQDAQRAAAAAAATVLAAAGNSGRAAVAAATALADHEYAMGLVAGGLQLSDQGRGSKLDRAPIGAVAGIAAVSGVAAAAIVAVATDAQQVHAGRTVAKRCHGGALVAAGEHEHDGPYAPGAAVPTRDGGAPAAAAAVAALAGDKEPVRVGPRRGNSPGTDVADADKDRLGPEPATPIAAATSGEPRAVAGATAAAIARYELDTDAG